MGFSLSRHYPPIFRVPHDTKRNNNIPNTKTIQNRNNKNNIKNQCHQNILLNNDVKCPGCQYQMKRNHNDVLNHQTECFFDS